jgi:GAF domain-containing protein
MNARANATEAALRVGPDALFGLLAERLVESVGYRLLTLLTTDEGGTRLFRPYSSKPDQFPFGVADPVEDTRWFRHLFVEQKIVVANDVASIRDWLPRFTDAEKLGYGSLLNLPIVVAGKVVGLINIMDRSNHFDERRVDAIRREAPLAALVLLARAASVPSISFPAEGETGSEFREAAGRHEKGKPGNPGSQKEPRGREPQSGRQ